jgi:hypothetical protein
MLDDLFACQVSMARNPQAVVFLITEEGLKLIDLPVGEAAVTIEPSNAYSNSACCKGTQPAYP